LRQRWTTLRSSPGVSNHPGLSPRIGGSCWLRTACFLSSQADGPDRFSRGLFPYISGCSISHGDVHHHHLSRSVSPPDVFLPLNRETPNRPLANCPGTKSVFPSACSGACCAVQRSLLLNDPAAILGRFVKPPEVGFPERAASLRFFAWCDLPADRTAYLRITRVRSRVMRRGDLLHAAFRYPLFRTPHDRAGFTSSSNRQRSWDFCTLRSFPFPAGPGV